MRTLGSELVRVDGTGDREGLVLDDLDAPEAVLERRNFRRKVWNGSLVGGEVTRSPEAQVVRRRVVRRIYAPAKGLKGGVG